MSSWSGRSLQKVTAMVMNDWLLYPLCSMSFSPPIPETWLFQNFAVKGQGHIFGSATNGYTSFSFHKIHPTITEIHLFKNLTTEIQGKVLTKVKTNGYTSGLVFNRYIHFLVLWQLDNSAIRYSKFHIWPWKFKVKVTTKIDQNLTR